MDRAKGMTGGARRKAAILLVAALLLAAVWIAVQRDGDGNGSASYKELPEVHLMVATDLHYLSPALTDHGNYFTAMVEHSDGRTMEYSEELAEAFVDTVIQNKPDALILTGNLTFNGARQSHVDLAAKLARIEDEGIPVLVMSGNHDMNSRYAASFSGDGYEFVDSVSPEEFAELYGDFGYRDSISRDRASYSYMWEPVKGLRLLMLDVNGVEKPGGVPEETLRWMEQQLKKARKSGSRVLAFSHQNLLKHSMFEMGYVIRNSDEVQKLYKEYDVIANFTGHLHIQHIGESEGMYEAATSAMAVYPNQYADIRLDSSKLEYSTASVDVASWAEQHRPDSEDLLDFAEYSRRFFWDTSCGQGAAELDGVRDPQRKNAMAEYFAELNQAYFSGRMEDVPSEDERLEEWRRLQSFAGKYIESIVGSERVDQNHMELVF